MHRVFRFLLAMAVLWCGLDLSPAEAGGALWMGDEAVAHARAADQGDDSHPGADPVHQCHKHCPVAPAIGHAPAIGLPDLARTMLFPLPGWSLTTAAQAPPIEPPSA